MKKRRKKTQTYETLRGEENDMVEEEDFDAKKPQIHVAVQASKPKGFWSVTASKGDQLVRKQTESSVDSEI